MFFSISKHINNDFPNHIKWGEFCVDFDNGWTINENYISKGYPGKSCAISYSDDSVHVDSGERQTFPMFIDAEKFVVSNLLSGDFFVGEVSVTANSIIRIDKPSSKFKKLNLTDSEIIDQIDTTIENTILNFETDKPVKLFLTGGVDTLLLAAYVVKNKIPYELVNCEHFDLDYFMCHNRSKLKQFWAYKSLQHWRTPEVLLSGANGDEMLMRNPYDACIVLNYFNEDIVEVCKQQPYYHSGYFLKEKFASTLEAAKQIKFHSEAELKEHVVIRNSNDFQHWHLGNTITLSPYDNLNLINLVLNLSYPILRTQILDAGIHKLLIERNAPQLLRLLSNDKNTNNFKKLAGIYEGLESL
jgi:hypothetical protein